MVHHTALIKKSLFETYKFGNDGNEERVNEWIKNLNQNQEFALHRECKSIEPPTKHNIYEIIKLQGLQSIHVKNQIGVTVFEYLQKNPYTDTAIDEHKLITRLVLDLMGEIIIT